jgi:PAS domain S-box-containing protein
MDSRILIVDDNPKNLQVLGNILNNEAYIVEFALNGKTAISWLESESFDLVLLDIMMPEMDGFEVCELIRNKLEDVDTPIVFLTAKTSRESVIHGFEIGGNDYIAKPFDSRELLVRVKTQIELRKSKKALKSLNLELENKVKERTVELEKINLALEESKATYCYALEASNDCIWDWDLDTDTIELSVGLYKMLGYEPDEFPQSRQEINKRTHPDDLESRDKEEYLPKLRKNKKRLFQNEYRLRTKGGNYKWFKVKGQVVERNDKNEISRVIGTYTDITAEKRKNYEIMEAVLKTEDAERRRISKDIHDGLQQTLTVSLLNFEYIKKEVVNLGEEAQSKYRVGCEYLHKSITDSRVVAYSLMPQAIVDFGLVSSCEYLAELMNKTVDQTHFSFIHNLGNTRIENQQLEITLYRIVQEAINNIIKYAKASNVDIQLKNYDDIILLTIEDNGVGFDPKTVKFGLGLKNIQNRLEPINGMFEINSRPKHGTTIIVEIEKSNLLSL